MRSAKRGKEVVEREVVGQVDHFQPRAPLVAVSVEDVVVAHSEIKQIALLDTRRVEVVVFFVRRRNFYERRTKG